MGIGKRREIIDTIECRKLQYLSHIIRVSSYSLLWLAMQEKIQSERRIGRSRIPWVPNLLEWFNCTLSDLFKTAVSIVEWFLRNFDEEVVHKEDNKGINNSTNFERKWWVKDIRGCETCKRNYRGRKTPLLVMDHLLPTINSLAD